MNTGYYTGMKAEELVGLYKNGDERAFEALMCSTEKLRAHLALKYLNIPGSELDDLLSEGAIAMMEAAKNFDESKGAAFTTFLYKHISRRYDKLYSQASAKKRNVNVEVKVHSYIDNLDTDSTVSGDRDFLRSKDYFSVVCDEFDMIEMRMLIDSLKLSEKERVVVNLLIEGCSKPDIAKHLGVKVPSVHSYIKRIGNKLNLSLACA